MEQQQADKLVADMLAIRQEFYSPIEIAAAYGVTKSAVLSYLYRAEQGTAQLVRVRDHNGDWLIPKAEAERVWGRWQGRR